MQLQSLSIQLDEYGVYKGRYVGSASFKGQYGDVKVVLSPDASDKCLQICADAIVQNAKELAETLTAETMAQTNQLAIPAPRPISNSDDDIPF